MAVQCRVYPWRHRQQLYPSQCTASRCRQLLGPGVQCRQRSDEFERSIDRDPAPGHYEPAGKLDRSARLISKLQRGCRRNTAVELPMVATSSNAILTVPLAATAGLLTSSTNPSLPGQSVSFTIALSAVLPAVGTPGGTVQFKTDGTTAGAPASLSSGTASYTTATLAHGTHL